MVGSEELSSRAQYVSIAAKPRVFRVADPGSHGHDLTQHAMGALRAFVALPWLISNGKQLSGLDKPTPDPRFRVPSSRLAALRSGDD